MKFFRNTHRTKLFFFFLLFGACATKRATDFDVKSQHVKSGANFAMSSDGVESARIGEEIYKLGGNWADIFVATSFAISVEKPQSTGIGGGGFALVHIANEKKTYAFDFRETAPAALAKKYKEILGPDGKRRYELSSESVKGAGVPGIIAGLAKIHALWGKLPWKSVMAPAIQLAQQGFRVDSLLAAAIVMNKEKLEKDSQSQQLYLPQKTPLKVGELLKQPELAATLRLIAEKGPSEFYRGSLAKKIVAYSKKSGGYLSLNDFTDYKVMERAAMKWKEQQYEIVAFPFPSFGGEATQLIQSDDGIKRRSSDEALVKEWVPTLERVFEFRAKRYENASEKTQTTHMSLIDKEGNAVSSTQTVNSAFASGKIVPGTGILLNDEMDDFYFEDPQALNHPIRSARPLSSMSPLLIFDQHHVKLATGAHGGRRILSCVNWVLANYLWQGKTLEEAVSSPRVHVAYPAKKLIVEKTAPASWINSFHEYKVEAPAVDCRTQSVERSGVDATLKSVVDPRSTGRPLAL